MDKKRSLDRGERRWTVRASCSGRVLRRGDGPAEAIDGQDGTDGVRMAPTVMVEQVGS
jgi:hypothetical protein